MNDLRIPIDADDYLGIRQQIIAINMGWSSQLKLIKESDFTTSGIFVKFIENESNLMLYGYDDNGTTL